jgi:hypothetical protein
MMLNNHQGFILSFVAAALQRPQTIVEFYGY